MKTKLGKIIRNLLLSILIGVGFIIAGFFFPEPKSTTEDSPRYTCFIVGFLVLMFFGGSYLHSIFTGKIEMGSSTKSFRCPNCHHELNINQIPSDSGLNFKCPHCGHFLKP